jgi:glycosyltransferase involved in cell wall biosynthesis
LRRIDRVLAKTRHAYDIFSATGAPTVHFGFMSDDCLDAGVERDWNGFFHLAGGSTVKGTEDLLALWARHPDWPRLHLVQKQALAPTRVPSNVELITRHLSDEDLRRLQNQSGMHLCPSRSEGWGHHLVEAMSCGALVLTTDAPPMNEHIDEACGVLVTSARQQARHLGTDYFVDPAALEAAVARMIAMPAAEKMARGQAARRRYLATVDAFHSHVAEMFAASKNVG